ncbi:MAG: hypothetical protein IKZ62_08930 [Prevotella sp.]|nr:hypothetical protein [Prevotella sp.]
MKKIFTLILMSVMTVAAHAAINIYVQCETAPFIWWWGADGGLQNSDKLYSWPGTIQFTEKYTHPDTGDEFWMYTFPDEVTIVSFLLNNGESEGTKQTGDVKDVVSDRYFILSWDDGEGNVSLQDVTEDYTEIPDAEVKTLGISGSIEAWGWDDPTVFAEVIEAGKTFKFSFDPSTFPAGTKNVAFKFRPNGTSWMGYWDVYYNAEEEPVAGKTPNSEAPKWLEATGDGNFKVDLTKYTASAFTFTLTWNGGKSATENWTIKCEATNLEELDPEPVDKTWTIAGVPDLCGAEWDPTNVANDMVKGDDGLYKLTLTGVELAAGNYEFKVVADHDWSESYGEGSGNKILTIEAAGTYDVTFTFNAETKELSVEAVVSTGIKNVKNNTKSSAMYNLQGQRVQEGFRGVVIMNGRKVVMK